VNVWAGLVRSNLGRLLRLTLVLVTRLSRHNAGAVCSFRDERIGQRRDKASADVAEHPEIGETVRRLLLEARKAENAALGAPVTPVAASQPRQSRRLRPAARDQ
jgi:hypothetical protein